MKQIAVLALALLSACNLTTSERPPPNSAQPANTNEASPEIPPPPATGPDAKTPLGEPKGAIDPKSVEAAGQVVQHYGALIQQDRWEEAAKYWGHADAAAAFARQLQDRRLKHLEIGKPGDSEGAAGSIYVTIPVVFYSHALRYPADAILRRVNDVPGSTEAERSWHIERIEWKDA
jgi:hypothetical protein